MRGRRCRCASHFRDLRRGWLFSPAGTTSDSGLRLSSQHRGRQSQLGGFVDIADGVIAQQWQNPRVSSRILPGMEGLDWSDGELRVHVSYLAQIDPESALSVIEGLTLRQSSP